MSRPKSKVPSEISPSLKSAAATLGLDVAVLKDAKARGCPAFRANQSVNRAVLVEWLKNDREEKAKRAAERQQARQQTPDDDEPPLDVEGETEGVGKAFQRLVAYEVRALKALNRAIEEGNDLVIKAKEDAWLKVLRELLRYELGVEVAKRDAGELIPRSEVVDLCRAFLSWHQVGLSDAIRSAIPRIVGLTSPREVAFILDPIIRESQALAFDIGTRAGLVPSWLAEAAMNQKEPESTNT
jgi:hypothetical protein